MHPQGSIVDGVGRSGNVNDYAGSLCSQFGDWVAVVASHRPEVLVVPHVLANRDAQLFVAEAEYFLFRGWLKIARLVEYIVGRQQHLALLEDNLAAAQQRGLIRYTAASPILVFADVAHNGGPRQLRRQLLQFFLISIDEGRTLQQILGQVAANTKLGENGQVRSPSLGAFRQGKNACSIARKIADGGIELRQRNFHVGSLEYVRRPAFANRAAISCRSHGRRNIKRLLKWTLLPFQDPKICFTPFIAMPIKR